MPDPREICPVPGCGGTLRAGTENGTRRVLACLCGYSRDRLQEPEKAATEPRHETALKLPGRPAPLRMTLDVPTEDEEQEALFKQVQCMWTRCPALQAFYMIPNGGRLRAFYAKDRNGDRVRICPEGERLKLMGLRPGFPDIGLAIPSGEYHGLFIELKRVNDTPSKTKPELRARQEYWADLLRRNGYRVVRCNGWRVAWAMIVEYLGLPEEALCAVRDAEVAMLRDGVEA